MQMQSQPPRVHRPPDVQTSGGGFGLRLTEMRTGNTPEQIPPSQQQEERAEEFNQRQNDEEMEDSDEELADV